MAEGKIEHSVLTGTGVHEDINVVEGLTTDAGKVIQPDPATVGVSLYQALDSDYVIERREILSLTFPMGGAIDYYLPISGEGKMISCHAAVDSDIGTPETLSFTVDATSLGGTGNLVVDGSIGGSVDSIDWTLTAIPEASLEIDADKPVKITSDGAGTGSGSIHLSIVYQRYSLDERA